MKLKLSILAVLVLLINGCISKPPHDDLSPEDKVIAAHSEGDEMYRGFYNNFMFRITIEDTEVMKALHAKLSDFYKWDDTRRQKEWSEFQSRALAETEAFISFYTPDNKDDNLDLKNSIWRIYLDVNGQRYEGKARKDRRQGTEVMGLFYYHTRWNTPYLISFPVPLGMIEGKEGTLTVTGPLGTKSVQFRAGK